MPSIINTNIASLNAQRNLNASQASLNDSIQRLSSGLRINSAKDDAAGLAIATRMTSQIRGQEVASRNANDAISLVQTAEGALGSITDSLQRMRELSVQSANATNSADDRAALNAEVTQLIAEIDRVATTTTFNGINLLDASFTAQDFQVGANATDTIQIAAIDDAQTAALGVDALDISTAAGATAAITALDTAIQSVADSRADLGAYQNRFSNVISNLANSVENLTAAKSRITDTDFAAETAKLTRGQILQQAGTAMLAQANQLPQGVLALLRG